MLNSPVIRLANLQPSELPAHPLLTSTDSPSITRPDLIPFVRNLLGQTEGFLHPLSFNQHFKSHSHKPSPPSNTDVETLTYTATAEEISKINWSDPSSTAGVGRSKPRDISTEHWCARRSYHANVSSKVNPATASWEEFVFGLRDNHSKHEQDFTPTLYDARHILDWNQELETAARSWGLGDRESEAPDQSYTNLTLSIYEMCHEIPFPLSPRCFPVLVATASTSANRFIACTVPVNLTSFEGAFYSNGRHRTEGQTSVQRKQVVLGAYAAVESCELSSKEAKDGGKKEETIEWIMATASDAKGNVPMAVQKNSMPGQVVKDVGFFLKWIHRVDPAVIRGEEKPSTSTNDDATPRAKGLSVGSAK